MPDTARDPEFVKRRRRRRISYAVAGPLVLLAVSIVVARMEPAPPMVNADVLVRDTVKRGSFVRTVNGPGALVPEDTHWISASTAGRVRTDSPRLGGFS
jgi:hypothetical protein